MDYHFIIKYIPDWIYLFMLLVLICCGGWCFYDEHLRGFVDKWVLCLKCPCLGRDFRVGGRITSASVYPQIVVGYEIC